MQFFKIIILTCSCLLAGFQTFSQTKIDLFFPRFANEAYIFSLSQGEKQDTISSAFFDTQGKAQIQIPKQYQSYAGVSQLRVTNGSGLDLILNQEPHIKVSIVSEEDQELLFQNSPENTDLSAKHKKHQDLYQKGLVMMNLAAVYTPQDSLYSVLNKERIRLEEEYAIFMQEEQTNPLYAAHLRKMQYFLGDIGNTLTQEQPERIEGFRRYFREELDYSKAYTSGLWRPLIESWMAMHKQAVLNDSLLLDDCKTILTYIPTNDLKKAWLTRMIPLFAYHGKDDMLMKLGVEDLISVGTYAPQLALPRERRMINNAVVIFHESGCHNCEKEMVELRKNYPTIKEAGYQVYSISADIDTTVFDYNTFILPWKEKHCDFNGFQGENFRNYGVFGTPTIFVVNNEGIIIGRYAQVHEVLDRIRKEE